MPDASGQAAMADGDREATIEAASACLDRFTEHFNAGDTAGMDAELHFPHVRLIGAQAVVWPAPGQVPAGWFDSLKAGGWRRTRYDARMPVLVGTEKVHFVVDYSRLGADDLPISTHRDLWIVTRVAGRWGIAVRSA